MGKSALFWDCFLRLWRQTFPISLAQCTRMSPTWHETKESSRQIGTVQGTMYWGPTDEASPWAARAPGSGVRRRHIHKTVRTKMTSSEHNAHDMLLTAPGSPLSWFCAGKLRRESPPGLCMGSSGNYDSRCLVLCADVSLRGWIQKWAPRG